MDWRELCLLGRALPEAEEGIWYRTPSLKVRGKGFVRLKEDGQSVVFLVDSVDEQEFLVATQPALYFITDHYRGYAMVLARLAALSVREAKLRIERSWQLKAPAALLKQRAAKPARATKTAAKPAPATKTAAKPAPATKTAAKPARATKTAAKPARATKTAAKPARATKTAAAKPAPATKTAAAKPARATETAAKRTR